MERGCGNEQHFFGSGNLKPTLPIWRNAQNAQNAQVHKSAHFPVLLQKVMQVAGSDKVEKVDAFEIHCPPFPLGEISEIREISNIGNIVNIISSSK